jgi:hypothetical protein
VFSVLTLLAFAGIATIVWESRAAKAGQAVAEQRLSQAVEMANRTLSDLSGSTGQLPGTTSARKQMARKTMEYLGRLAKDTDNDPRVLMALATAYVRVGEVLGNSNFSNLGDLPGPLGSYQKALDIIGALLARDPGNRKIESLAAAAHQGKDDVLGALGRAPEAQKEDWTAARDFPWRFGWPRRNRKFGCANRTRQYLQPDRYGSRPRRPRERSSGILCESRRRSRSRLSKGPS